MGAPSLRNPTVTVQGAQACVGHSHSGMRLGDGGRQEKEEEAQTKTLGFYYISLQRAQKYKEASAPEGGAGGRACPEQPDPQLWCPCARSTDIHSSGVRMPGAEPAWARGRECGTSHLHISEGLPSPCPSVSY